MIKIIVIIMVQTAIITIIVIVIVLVIVIVIVIVVIIVKQVEILMEPIILKRMALETIDTVYHNWSILTLLEIDIGVARVLIATAKTTRPSPNQGNNGTKLMVQTPSTLNPTKP